MKKKNEEIEYEIKNRKLNEIWNIIVMIVINMRGNKK